MDTPDEGMYGYDPERHGRVSGHEQRGEIRRAIIKILKTA
jgi:hypothetical protein